MAVGINKVYNKVLAIANKEQRGYITPQEFNLLANQAQMEIFEQYFYDLNQFSRVPGNDTRHADMVTTLEEKISLFEKTAAIVGSSTMTLPTDIYKLTSILYKDVEAEYISQKDLLYIKKSPLTYPTADRPIFTRDNDSIDVYYDNTFTKASTTADVTVNYIKKPITVKWGYVIVDAGNNTKQPLYDSSASATTNFELHISEESKLVISVLALAGIVIKQPDLYQVAEREETKTIQQEKQ